MRSFTRQLTLQGSYLEKKTEMEGTSGIGPQPCSVEIS